MIKAIIWDFGGVITTSPFESFNRYETQHDIPKDFIRTINATNPESNAWALFESNRISLDEFDQLFETETKNAGYTIPGRDVLKILAGELRPAMVEALKRCKMQFKIGCITNNMNMGHGPGMVKTSERAAQMEDVMRLFDVVIESRKEGIRKPDPEIYQLTLRRLDVKAHETIFLDDLGINLKPARQMGMKTIKVLDETQALKDLEALTGLQLK